MTIKVSPEEIALIAQNLAAIAGVFSPANAASIALLVQAATTVNTLVQRVRSQSAEDGLQVWAAVRTDYALSLSAFEASRPS
jgi:Asp-tRNA(Asn)/Glu-tRNA(Gln) amidotransferase C subunit